MEVYVHMDEGESDSSLYKGVGTIKGSASQNIEVGEVSLNAPASTLNTASKNALDTAPNTTPPLEVVLPNTQDPIDLVAAPSDSENSELSVKGSDESTDESPDSENGDLTGEDDYFSDVHEEYIELKNERRKAARRNRRERIPKDTEEVPCGEAGPDLGFDETAEVGKNN